MVRTPGITSILKYCEFNLISNNSKLKLLNENIGTFEVKYERNSPIIMGYFIFTDIFDIISTINLKEAKLEVYFNDIYDKTFIRYFKIMDVHESYDRMKSKNYMLVIIDEISYKLSNTYISKSFNISRVNSLNDIFSSEGIDDIIKNNKITKKFDSDSIVESFVLSKNVSVLDFFIKEFARIGLSFYQTRDAICIKKFDELLPNKLDEISDTFMYECKNQFYKNIIYEFSNKAMSGTTLINNPNNKTFYFDPNKKQVISIDSTYSDIKNEMSINNNLVDLQNTSGTIANFQNRMDSIQHINNIRESYLNTFKIEIIINGYMSNDINKIFNVQLPGHKGNKKSQYEGNVQSSGKYVSLSVVDKLIGDKLLQKVTLGRSDSQK